MPKAKKSGALRNLISLEEVYLCEAVDSIIDLIDIFYTFLNKYL